MFNPNREPKLTSFEGKIYLMMKKTSLLILLLSTAFAGKGQNLVPNGDFESFTNCPNNFNQFFGYVSNWLNPTTGTPDFFNQCTSFALLSVPDNNWGYQSAHSGVAYTGIINWYGPNPPDYREYIEVPLTSLLIANTCYYFEMYVCLAEASEYTTNNISVLFSDTAINNQIELYAFTPNINSSSGFITDTLNWTLISGNYIASGGESYLIIGNFDNNVSTITQLTGFGISAEAYFYIDDVSLTPCTGIGEHNNNESIKFYPNPVKDWLNVQIPNSNFQSNKAEIKITDILGKEILRQQSNLKSKILNLQFLQNGIYFIEINNGKNIYRKKFLKN